MKDLQTVCAANDNQSAPAGLIVTDRIKCEAPPWCWLKPLDTADLTKVAKRAAIPVANDNMRGDGPMCGDGNHPVDWE